MNRLEVARSAVLETAATLGAGDEVTLIGFDVEARTLLPLASFAAARPALEAPWPIAASGGTRIAPALGLGSEELARARSARRFLLLLTDGFVAPEPLAEVERALLADHVELIVLAIGDDADVAALEGIAARVHGAVLRVSDVAELPRFATLPASRVALRRGSIVVNSSQGGGTKDTWVIRDD